MRHRYNSKDDGGVYTVTGHILIAMNPFRELKIYDEKVIKQYLGRPIGSEPPHIYAVADRMYRLLVSSGESQAIVVSGPSGAGTCGFQIPGARNDEAAVAVADVRRLLLEHAELHSRRLGPEGL